MSSQRTHVLNLSNPVTLIYWINGATLQQKQVDTFTDIKFWEFLSSLERKSTMCTALFFWVITAVGKSLILWWYGFFFVSESFVTAISISHQITPLHLARQTKILGSFGQEWINVIFRQVLRMLLELSSPKQWPKNYISKKTPSKKIFTIVHKNC